MAQQEFKKGDRVKINGRSTTHVGATGTVTMMTGGQYWVKLDGTDELLPALQPWWLEPAA